MRWRVGASMMLMYVTLMLPLKTTACGQSACITVTSADLVNGQCPDPTAALMRFSDSSCGFSGPIASVDGAGTLSDGLCCYPVSVSSDPGDTPVPFCGEMTATVTGTGGGFAESVSSTGGTGGMGGACSASATCAAALNGQVPLPDVCGDAATILDQLKVCACASHCTASCDPTLCTGNAPDDGCLGCLEGACASQLKSCQAN